MKERTDKNIEFGFGYIGRMKKKREGHTGKILLFHSKFSRRGKLLKNRRFQK